MQTFPRSATRHDGFMQVVAFFQMVKGATFNGMSLVSSGSSLSGVPVKLTEALHAHGVKAFAVAFNYFSATGLGVWASLANG